MVRLMLFCTGSSDKTPWLCSILKSETVALKIDIKDWFQMKVVAKGDTFEGHYSGQLISEIKDKDLRKGKVGARVYDSTAHIDDLM